MQHGWKDLLHRTEHSQSATGAPTWRCSAVAAVAKDKPAKWTPLIDLVVDMAWEYLATQQPGTPVSKGPHLLHDLHQQPRLYQHLQSKLRTYKIRTIVGTETRDQKGGISYVDPRCPDSIKHADHTAQAVDGKCALITCAEAIERHGVQLQHPRLPCIAVLQTPWKDKSDPQDRYRTFPLECCWVDTVKPRTTTGDDDTAWVLTDHGHGIKCRMPSWIAECFDTSGGAASGPNTVEGPSAETNAAVAYTLESELSSVDSVDGTTNKYSCSLSSIALDSLRPGFSRWTKSLLPTKAEEQKMHSVVDTVSKVLQAACRGHVWNLVSMLPGGSFKKNTSLRNSHDLDVQVELRAAAGSGSFEAARRECLNAICTQLCMPASQETTADAVESVHWGWRLEQVPGHYLRLYHPDLNVQLDVQVSRSLHQLGLAPGNPDEQRKQLLDIMIQRAKAAHGIIHKPPEVHSSVVEELTCPKSDNRERVMIMAPLLTGLVRGVTTLYEREYGLQGAGSLVTTVIRACKAWAKFGLAEKLDRHRLGQHNNSSSSSSSVEHVVGGRATATASAAVPGGVQGTEKPIVRPPGYVWEMLVIYVLNQKLQQCKLSDRLSESLGNRSVAAVYSIGGIREISLFLDVLQAAAELLRPASTENPGQVSAIALHEWYTAEECELFRDAWGPPGPLFTPFIIHPADPSYNCTAHCSFKAWSVIADEAGLLHQQLQVLTEHCWLAPGQGERPDGCVSGSDSGDVWQKVLDTTTLGPAVRAFAADVDAF